MPAASIDDPTAVEGRRIAAWLIDLVLFAIALSAAVAATGGLSWTTHEFSTASEATEFCQPYESSTEKVCSNFGNQAALVRVGGSVNWPIVWFVCTLAYIVLQGVTGASPGKLAMGLRVVDVEGRNAGVGKSFLRTCLWLVDAITCGLPVVGGTLMTTSVGHQRYGDKVARTFVVRKAAVGSPLVIPPKDAAPYSFHLPPPGYVPPPGYAPPPGYGPPAYPPPQAPQGPAPSWPAPAGAPPFGGAYEPPRRPAVEAPDSDGPHWDDDRDTYIQYDRAVEMWVQWDEKAEHWRPIDT